MFLRTMGRHGHTVDEATQPRDPESAFAALQHLPYPPVITDRRGDRISGNGAFGF